MFNKAVFHTLIEFRMKNFRSIKNEAILSMVSSHDKTMPDHIIEQESLSGDRLLKTAGIYGANASGKSNILYGIGIMSNIVRKSHGFQTDNPLPYEPFKMDDEYLSRPTEFHVVFIMEGVKHAYGFSYNKSKIIDEYLHHYPKGRKKVIFERTDTSEYKFPHPRESEQSFIRERTPDNVLFLSRATQLNYSKTQDAYKWFNKLKFITPEDNDTLIRITSKLIESNEMRRDIINALKTADFGIDDIIPKNINEDIDPEGFNQNTKKIMMNNININNDQYIDLKDQIMEKMNSYNIISMHKGIPFDFFNEESGGTKRMYSLIGPIFTALREGYILFLDELDTKLHHLLNVFILDLFHDKKNERSQLIFTTHNTNLLDRNLFRRDQIWFTEKDPESGGSELYSLLEFRPRNDSDIQKGYLAGRYGALPFIKYEGFFE
jgi:AAA15 family ATPase/GTPase